MTLGASRLVRAVLLGALLGLHFYTRLHAQQVTPLQERHIYPFSYLVSLSLNEGGGFGYLLPASVTPEHAWSQPVPRPGDPFFPILSFFRLAGPESVTDAELAAYRRSGLYVAPAIPFESTRVLDIRVTSWLWRIFGVDWRPYFAFYALVSTIVAFAIFAIVVWATDSSWIGLAAIAGFTVSPLELYAGAWSTRDSVPLWFTALPFGVLAGFGALARGARSTLAGAFVLGASSLVGLGWRPDFQLVPPLVLAGLVATLASQRRSLPQVAQAVAAFATGCAVLVVVLLALGSGSYSQGSVVFHIAWYGESDRSNLFQTENAFQVARSDGLTLFQANYFAAARFGAGPGGSPAGAPYDSRHHRRCREMYLELARYQAAAWWNAFPRFLARAAALDRPTLLGSGVEASAFLDRRPGWFKTIGDGPFGRYGRLLPGLMLIGVVGGLLDRRARLTTALMAGYYVVYSAILLAVLPEAKHAIPLLLPVHVIGAIGVWSLVRAARELPQLVHSARHALLPMAVAVVVLAVGWSALSAVLHPVSVQQRRRILEAVREVARAPSRVPQEPGVKLFSVSPPATPSGDRIGYLMRLRTTRPANLLLVHVRGTSSDDGYHAYYTRHPIEPGADRMFFFNAVHGSAIGDPRPYTAHVRLVGPARFVSVERVDLTAWPLGLPLSVMFDEDDPGRGSTFVGPAATVQLASPSDVTDLLEDPGAALVRYHPR